MVICCVWNGWNRTTLVYCGGVADLHMSLCMYMALMHSSSSSLYCAAGMAVVGCRILRTLNDIAWRDQPMHPKGH